MGLVGDGASVHGQDAVADLQLPAAVCWAPLNDSPYFVRHGHTCISSFLATVNMSGRISVFAFVFGEAGKEMEEKKRRKGAERALIHQQPSESQAKVAEREED